MSGASGRARAAAIALPLLGAGCMAPPPILSLEARSCTASVQLAPASEVSFGVASGTTMMVDATAPCFETPAGRASYAVFRLPVATEPFQITVRSSARGLALLLPKAEIYDAQDRPRAAIDGFRAVRGALVASARGLPGDRYVVVASSPASVGLQRSMPTAGDPRPVRVAAAVFVPVLIPMQPTGPTTDQTGAVLAHSGSVTVTAMPYVTLP